MTSFILCFVCDSGCFLFFCMLFCYSGLSLSTYITLYFSPFLFYLFDLFIISTSFSPPLFCPLPSSPLLTLPFSPSMLPLYCFSLPSSLSCSPPFLSCVFLNISVHVLSSFSSVSSFSYLIVSCCPPHLLHHPFIFSTTSPLFLYFSLSLLFIPPCHPYLPLPYGLH